MAAGAYLPTAEKPLPEPYSEARCQLKHNVYSRSLAGVSMRTFIVIKSRTNSVKVYSLNVNKT
jgi:hypothetical protein